MPISVQDLLSDKRTITVETKVGNINLTYLPSAYVASLEDRSMRYIETNRPFSSLAQGLSQLVSDWDITGPLRYEHDNGDEVVIGEEKVVLPITLEVLTHLPGSLLVLMQTAINVDMKPKPDETKNSDAGSRKKAR